MLRSQFQRPELELEHKSQHFDPDETGILEHHSSRNAHIVKDNCTGN